MLGIYSSSSFRWFIILSSISSKTRLGLLFLRLKCSLSTHDEIDKENLQAQLVLGKWLKAQQSWQFQQRRWFSQTTTSSPPLQTVGFIKTDVVDQQIQLNSWTWTRISLYIFWVYLYAVHRVWGNYKKK